PGVMVSEPTNLTPPQAEHRAGIPAPTSRSTGPEGREVADDRPLPQPRPPPHHPLRAQEHQPEHVDPSALSRQRRRAAWRAPANDSAPHRRRARNPFARRVDHHHRAPAANRDIVY